MGGAERVLSLLANAWAEGGNRLTVITLSSTGNDAYPLHSAIQRIGLNLLKPAPTPIHGVINVIRRVFAVRRTLCRLKPQIAIAFMDRNNVLLSLASIGLSVKTIGTMHIHPPMCPIGGWVWRLAQRISHQRLHALVVLTNETARWVRKYAPCARIAEIPNPVSMPLPASPPYLVPSNVIPSSIKIIIGVGRLVPQKRFDLTIEAFSRIAQQHLSWQLVILGDGLLRPTLLEQIAESGLSGRIHLLGSVGNLGDWYKRASFLVMSSDFEGFGNVLIEGLAHGLPVISTDCPAGPREIVKIGVNGFLVNPGDVEGLAKSMNRLMGDSDANFKIGANSRDSARRWDLKNILLEWDDLFTKLNLRISLARLCRTSQKKPR
jgi:glycosyltransferase involved in cell wall biosynthesis